MWEPRNFISSTVLCIEGKLMTSLAKRRAPTIACLDHALPSRFRRLLSSAAYLRQKPPPYRRPPPLPPRQEADLEQENAGGTNPIWGRAGGGVLLERKLTQGATGARRTWGGSELAVHWGRESEFRQVVVSTQRRGNHFKKSSFQTLTIPNSFC